MIPLPFPWLAAGVAALALGLGVQTVRVERLKADANHYRKMASEARMEAGRYKSSADLCKAALGRQNDAIDRLKAKGDAQLAAADKAADDARAVAASAIAQSQSLLNARLKGATACERAEDVRRRFLEGVS
ncbi:MAG: hypothetical protein IM650_11340 [Phenylobacterium sp.]|uniref:hypothetical protein n=1 Tax=Phenylobacterium sp. TaxID=1871053 RepID=UPI0025CFECE7|nr:hypothetical protein [Phenylobacterium sp.]MCA6258674.1 hypothetical protein [Phenylobacterium sp.]MCA6264155.1 hypothetical protein [Phenylobacterium sp.]MCA6281385.1 hypothetical protein [Phenylobacterium sp.]MCA6308371.1 hypothetical protein [Phenylobacterium sp.]MCA6318946.1 hypothetical protein [Phenylobacterium sp.]